MGPERLFSGNEKQRPPAPLGNSEAHLPGLSQLTGCSHSLARALNLGDGAQQACGPSPRGSGDLSASPSWACPSLSPSRPPAGRVASSATG